MIIDNFEAFGFDFVPWEFYYIQILNRDKSSGNNKTRCIKTYYVDTQEYFDKKKQEMIEIAKTTHSRVYVHPARRDKKRIALQMITYVAKCIEYEEIDRLRRWYETVCGRNQGTEKMWIIDIDTKDESLLQTAIEHIEAIQPFRKPYKILPTVHGYHLIYKGGFDRSSYKLEWDIHTNNPTVIYAVSDDEPTEWKIQNEDEDDTKKHL